MFDTLCDSSFYEDDQNEDLYKEPEVEALAGWICDILDKLGDSSVRTAVRAKVEELCRRFPVYEH